MALSGSGSGTGTLPFFLRVQIGTYDIAAEDFDRFCRDNPNCVACDTPQSSGSGTSGSGFVLAGPPSDFPCEACIPDSLGNLTVPAWFSPPGFTINYSNNTINGQPVPPEVFAAYLPAASAWQIYCQANCDHPDFDPDLPGGGLGGGDAVAPILAATIADYDMNAILVNRVCIDVPICLPCPRFE